MKYLDTISNGEKITRLLNDKIIYFFIHQYKRVMEKPQIQHIFLFQL